MFLNRLNVAKPPKHFFLTAVTCFSQSKTTPKDLIIQLQHANFSCLSLNPSGHVALLTFRSLLLQVPPSEKRKTVPCNASRPTGLVLIDGGGGINNWYKTASSTVFWAQQTSKPFNIMQGIRQGGVLSTTSIVGPLCMPMTWLWWQVLQRSYKLC